MWTVEHGIARFNTPRLTGHVDVADPGKGLFDLRWNDVPLLPMRLGAIGLLAADHAGPQARLALDSCSVRDDVLRLDFEDSASQPTHLQIHWQARDSSANGIWLDQHLSIETLQRQLEPRVNVTSILPGEQLQLAGHTELSRVISLPDVADASPAIDCDAWSWNIASFRHEPAALVCTQIMDTTDVDDDRIVDSGGQVERRIRLFAAPLEKGVIRSGVIRTVLAPHVDWMAATGAAWLDLCHAFPLPRI